MKSYFILLFCILGGLQSFGSTKEPKLLFQIKTDDDYHLYQSQISEDEKVALLFLRDSSKKFEHWLRFDLTSGQKQMLLASEIDSAKESIWAASEDAKLIFKYQDNLLTVYSVDSAEVLIQIPSPEPLYALEKLFISPNSNYVVGIANGIAPRLVIWSLSKKMAVVAAPSGTTLERNLFYATIRSLTYGSISSNNKFAFYTFFKDRPQGYFILDLTSGISEFYEKKDSGLSSHNRFSFYSESDLIFTNQNDNTLYSFSTDSRKISTLISAGPTGWDMDSLRAPSVRFVYGNYIYLPIGQDSYCQTTIGKLDVARGSILDWYRFPDGVSITRANRMIALGRLRKNANYGCAGGDIVIYKMD